MQRTFARTGTCQLTPAPVRWRESCSAGAGAGARPRSAPSSRRRTCARPAPCVPRPDRMETRNGHEAAHGRLGGAETHAAVPRARLRVGDGLRAHDARGAAEQGVPARGLAHDFLLPRPRPPQVGQHPHAEPAREPAPRARRACAAPCAWRGAPRPLPPCATRFGEPTLPCPTPTLPAAAARGPRTARASVTGPPCPGVRLAPARPASKKLTCARGARASTVSAVMRRNTVTGRACPMRCTRPIACCSTAGSTLGSSKNTLLAARAHPTLCNARQCVHD